MEQKEKVILVGVNINNQGDFQYSMEELKSLAQACNLQVVGSITQNLNKVNTSHYIGTGKLEEVNQLKTKSEADVIIFNDELSTSQIRNLENELDCKVMDRANLILDIFGSRAKTKEAQLQVEIAKFKYLLPRLINSDESLSQQRGGTGTIMRGPGETRLELERRKIEEKVSQLNKELETMVAHRQTQRKQRKRTKVPVVSLVGYTNTGKSTIMNAMVDLFSHNPNKHVFEKDMLFATLETSVRSIKLPDNKSFLLTDTVGFVSKLPHHLIKAFRSTLEEVAEAHLLIHVVDISHPNYKELINITNNTLEEIGVKDIPTIYAYNKGDLIDIQIPKIDGNNVYLSAKQRIGINELTELIKKELFQDHVKCQLLIPFDEGQLISYLNETANVISTDYEPNGTKLTLECSPQDYERFQGYVVGEKN